MPCEPFLCSLYYFFIVRMDSGSELIYRAGKVGDAKSSHCLKSDPDYGLIIQSLILVTKILRIAGEREDLPAKSLTSHLLRPLLWYYSSISLAQDKARFLDKLRCMMATF